MADTIKCFNYFRLCNSVLDIWNKQSELTALMHVSLSCCRLLLKAFPGFSSSTILFTPKTRPSVMTYQYLVKEQRTFLTF